MVDPARQKLGDECPTVSSWFCAANGFVEREKRKKKLSKRLCFSNLKLTQCGLSGYRCTGSGASMYLDVVEQTQS